MTSFEDLLFTFMCIVCAKNYVRVPFLNYHYRIRQGSLSNKGRDAWEIARNMIESVKFIEKFAAKNDFLIQKPSAKYMMIDFFAGSRLNIMGQKIFAQAKLNPDEVYEFVRRNIFGRTTLSVKFIACRKAAAGF